MLCIVAVAMDQYLEVDIVMIFVLSAEQTPTTALHV